MKMDWTSKIFSPYFNFYVDGEKMGKMEKNAFATHSVVEWNGDRYEFERESYISSVYTLRDGDRHQLLTVDFDFLYRRATVRYAEEQLTWRLSNFYGSKWVMESDHEAIAEGHSHFTNGTIDIHTNKKLPIFLIFPAFLGYYYYTISIIAITLILLTFIL